MKPRTLALAPDGWPHRLDAETLPGLYLLTCGDRADAEPCIVLVTEYGGQAYLASSGEAVGPQCLAEPYLVTPLCPEWVESTR